MRGFYCVYIFFIMLNFSFCYFARPHKLQSFFINCAEIKAVCPSVCLSFTQLGIVCKRPVNQGAWPGY